jgi:nitrogen fixation/metabolism regulation signal transduction histidine kinase
MTAASDSARPALTIDAPAGNPEEAPGTRLWLRRGFAANLSLMVVVLSILTGLATYVILTGLTPIHPTRSLIIGLLAINSVLIAMMGFIIGWQVWRLLVARRQRIAGAGLHLRLVGLLSLSAALPALIVAVFATVTLNRGLDAWFSERTQSIVETSVSVALSYIEEQVDVARGDVQAMAASVAAQADVFNSDRQLFIRRLASFAAMRGVHGAFLIDAERKQIEANITANDSIVFRPPDQEHLEAAAEGEVIVIGPGDGNVIRGLARVEGLEDRFVYIYRLVNPELVEQLGKARDQKDAYDRMLEQRAGVQITFGLMYAGVTFVFLLAAVWLGLWFADRLVEPIVSLVHAARRVSRGDLNAKVRLDRAAGDLATLGQAFNQMTEQLQAQRNELVNANDQLDTRRRFTEAVLAGVTAGVFGLDSAGRITLMNRSAVRLLRTKASALVGRSFPEAIEAMRPVYEQALAKPSGSAQVQVNMRVESQERSFVVRVTTERSSEDEHGFVVTFDDITELVAAQRNSAWADIARRIAHEIKNPLTPIQLSAERLKRKYGRRDHDRPAGVRAVHRNDHPPGRRHRPHGRRVLRLRPHAERRARAARPQPDRQGSAGAAAGERQRPRVPTRPARQPAGPAGRPPAGFPGRHQSGQERQGGHRGAAAGRRRAAGAHRGEGGQERRGRHRGGRRQRHRAAARGPRPAHRTLHDDAREGHRPRPRHRQADHGRARGRHRADGCTGHLRRGQGALVRLVFPMGGSSPAGDNTGPAGDANGAK